MDSHSSITEQSVATWCGHHSGSDNTVYQRLWDAYFHRMVMVARRKLLGSRRTVRDEEDIAMSAFNSFCQGLRGGRFQGPQNLSASQWSDQNNLWPLLVSLTLNKAIDQIRKDNRQKRGGSGDAGQDPIWSSTGPELLDHLAGENPDPALSAIAEEAMDRLMDKLDQSGNADLREIVLASFEGESASEIAQRLNCSTRTVQRKLSTARALWESESQ